MKKQIHIKFAVVALLVFFTQFAMGSFSGADDKSKNKYSLESLSFLAKNYSLSTLHNSHFKFLGSQDFLLKQNDNGLEVNSMIRLQNGNTTYIYPYKYVIKLPKFKTPSAQ